MLETVKRNSSLPRIALTTTVALSLLAAGCTAEEDQPEYTAGQLAKALTSGKLQNVRFAGASTKQAKKWLRTATSGMEPASMRVRAGDVQENDGTAEATLRYRWTVDEQSWTYRTTAELTREEDEWAVRLQPSLLEPSLQQGEKLELERLSPERGDILGTDDEPIVTERPVLRFGIDKTRVDPEQQEDSARSLADLLEVDADSFADQVNAAGEQAFVEAIVLREGDVTPAIDLGYQEIEGASALPDELALAPTREFARPILGTVGDVTAEVIEQNPDVYQVGDKVGLSGLQQRYEKRLRGAPGFAVRATSDGSDSDGSDSSDSGGDNPGGSDSEERTLFRTKPRNGGNLRITLHQGLQLAAERILTEAVGDDSASALVAIRPSDGDVLVAADGPGTSGLAASTVGQYPPGSTFKVATTLALLRNGVSPSTTVSCPTNTTVDGKNFENYDDYPSDATGDIRLRTAFAQSCNTAFILQRSDLPADGLSEAAASLGLGVDHDLGFPAYLGSVPPSSSPTEKAAGTIGQGEMLASPLAMASVAASVANGETVRPRLLVAPRPKQDEAADKAAGVEPLTAREAKQLRSLMRGVVTDGSGSFLADVPGEDVLAKTGTAEFERDGELRTHAWMIAAQGDLAVAAFVELGESGSATAGPIVEDFLRAAADQ